MPCARLAIYPGLSRHGFGFHPSSAPTGSLVRTRIFWTRHESTSLFPHSRVSHEQATLCHECHLDRTDRLTPGRLCFPISSSAGTRKPSKACPCEFPRSRIRPRVAPRGVAVVAGCARRGSGVQPLPDLEMGDCHPRTHSPSRRAHLGNELLLPLMTHAPESFTACAMCRAAPMSL